MLYALVNGIKELPKKGLIGICPVCEEQLIPKCGTINIHHWSHKKDSECEYRNDNDMCQWHKYWQNLFDKENQEVIIKKNGKRKMADVYINGMTIEFQHSYISNDEIKKRENHYDNLIWIFDFTDNNLNVKKNIYDDCSILILDMKYNMRLYYDNNKKFRNIPKDKLLNVIKTFNFYENLKKLIKKWEDEDEKNRLKKIEDDEKNRLKKIIKKIDNNKVEKGCHWYVEYKRKNNMK